MKKILIVEDDKKYQKLLHDAFLEEKYTVFVANNGEEGLEQVKAQNIDLILLDILMPKMDGITFYNNLKNVLKKHIPVIVLTNVSSTTGYDENVKDVLIKANVSLEDVVKKVKQYI